MRLALSAPFVLVAIGALPAFAESTPSVEEVARRDVLIVKCRTEIREGRANFRVLESWKGKYSEEMMYVRPVAGCLYTRGVDAKSQGAMHGQETLFFYSDNAVSAEITNKGKILADRPDMTLPIIDGKVTWPISDLDSTVYTLDELKNAVLSAAKGKGNRKSR